ncbi:beta-lactamase [Hyaloraphidium curvatum]|nr:beta-lactamase [Hyaloraphidium curvatum]
MQAAIDSLLASAVGDGTAPHVAAAASVGGKTVYSGSAGGVSDKASWRIMSMTKMITSVALLQLVEQGKVSIDDPVTKHLPELAPLKVASFPAEGAPTFSEASRPPTIRELATHTAGYSYCFFDPNAAKAFEALGLAPELANAKKSFIESPLMFEPGSKWWYGTNIDTLGFVVEKVSGKDLGTYMKDHIFDVLGMHETSMEVAPEGDPRHVPVHLRSPDSDALSPLPLPVPPTKDFDMGGGGLSSTPADYLKFLHDVISPNPKLLQRSTIEQHVFKSHLKEGHEVTVLPAAYPYVDARSFIPGKDIGHSLACAVSGESVPGMRSKGSLAWAGLLNSYFFADPEKDVCGVICTQILPFADKKVVPLFEKFEKAVYAHV